MSLQNLLKIGTLQEHTADRTSVQKLLASASRNLTDAQSDAISNDNRFDAAYKTIMQCAMVGLWTCGYRTSTNQPGHHQTAIQSLSLTMGVEASKLIVLDALRKRRNINDYLGDPIADAALKSCIEEATSLLAHATAWLASHHPKLAAGA